MSDVTRILKSIEEGDQTAAEDLLPLVYDELRKLAAARMAHEPCDHTLQATALVHEAYVRLVDTDQARRWNSRGHFFAAAAEAMRRILVESARRKQLLKHGGDHQRITLTDPGDLRDRAQWDFVDLDEALARFEALEPEKSQLVKLRFFGGLTIEQAAAAMGISCATAKRYWVYARAWLYGHIRGRDESPQI